MDRNALERRPHPMNLPNPVDRKLIQDPLDAYKMVTGEVAAPYRRTRKREVTMEATGYVLANVLYNGVKVSQNIGTAVRGLREGIVMGLNRDRLIAE